MKRYKLAVKIALRYVFSLKTFHFISVITFLSMIGISVGVASLIIVTAVFNGFRDFTEEQIAGFDPHLRILPKSGAFLNDADSLMNLISSTNLAHSVVPVLSARCVAVRNKKMQVINLNGADENKLLEATGIKKFIVMGDFNKINTENNFLDLPRIALGAKLADGLNALAGDTIVLFSPQLIESSLLEMNLSTGVQARVAALFNAPSEEVNSSVGFCSKELIASLLNKSNNTVSFIDLRLNNRNDVDNVKPKIQALIGDTYNVISWRDLHQDLFKIMKFEATAAFLVLSLIIIIAAFNLLASLSLTVFEKISDISALRSFGADNKLIKMIFIAEGMLVGIISTITGLIIGLGFCWGQAKYGWVSLKLLNLDPSLYLIKAIPVTVNITSVLATIIFTLLLSFLVTIHPASRAITTNISDGLRYE